MPKAVKKKKVVKDKVTLSSVCTSVMKSVQDVEVLNNPKGFISDIKGRVPSGCLPLDFITGGGFPYGRIILAYGRYSSGKSTLSKHVLAETQKIGGIGCLIDIEGTEELSRCVSVFGIDKKKLFYYSPKKMKGKDGDVYVIPLERVFRLIHSTIDNLAKLPKKLPLITFVLDTISAAATEKEIIEGKDHMGYRGRMLRQELRKLGLKLQMHNAILLVLAQTSTDLKTSYDVPSEGGGGFKFHASLRIRMRKSGLLETPEGNGISVVMKVEKSKVCEPYREVTACLLFNKGFHQEFSVLNMLVDEGVIPVSEKGGWHYLDDTYDNKAFYYKNWMKMLRETPGLWDYYLNKLEVSLSGVTPEEPEELKLEPVPEAASTALAVPEAVATPAPKEEEGKSVS